ncbi:hypothetical protein JIN77_05165 [Verrucomicrobiaceae bacterium R5-34]|uniref:Cytochrome c domain-containing protein n=1 Tax=Oceaniferula flava TaxID=2800421 RepID=A0AAE2SBA3_9BACT|nr:hypothetical protein [Oceaniferula flavus]MBK1830100.1 hypothetical protein [Verrucomicrobiaceae bacterium R5-34]MBK1855031.1 hypothetical protein [Oceaniferula flavus]MBM1136337.1 hypothetical protein [Oceaniferula flavus]
MKALYPLGLLLAAITLSCSTQDEPKEAPFKPVMPYEPVKNTDLTKHEGHSLYMKTCYQCHQQADPTSLSEKKWSMTVPAMATHAGITQSEGQQVLEYILNVKSEGLR